MSKTDAAMAERLANLKPGTLRHRALVEARKFKASWVALGKELLAVQGEGAHRAWGFERFAEYCRQELHIREETARKLTRSYTYLETHAPRALDAASLAHSAPPIDVVDLLRQARGRTSIDTALFAELEADALDTAKGLQTRQQVLARLKAADPANFGASGPGAAGAEAPAGAAVDAAVPPAADLAAKPVDPRHARKVLLLAERLQALLHEQPALGEQDDLLAIDRLAATLRRRVLQQAQADTASSGQPSLATASGAPAGPAPADEGWPAKGPAQPAKPQYPRAEPAAGGRGGELYPGEPLH